jgi:ectoine hydroxylase-related dioxygenase (phytanoyl-CoA dioxygenase family)
MLLFKDKINYKLPGANGFVAHIDAPAYEHMNDKKLSFVEMMIAIDPQSAENGCLEMVPASHKSPIPLANGGRLDLDWEVKASWVPVTTQPGT